MADPGNRQPSAFVPLSSAQRSLLARTVAEARREAEKGAREALSALAVAHHEPFGHMEAGERALRKTLREHGRQLGDVRDPKRGTQEIDRLAHEVAFEHWHRMLFARFLAENNLLIHPDHQIAVSIADCIDLARDQGQDPWELAATFAQDMLPQIFRKDDPALRVSLPANRRTAIEKLLANLPAEVFTATDSLGWTYQFWQSEKKAEVDGRKEAVGADDIPAKTQLFTEHYMVEFLLHNTLGAWHAGRVLDASPQLAQTAQTEDDLRQAVAVDGCDWKYLRFVRPNGGDSDPEDRGPWVVGAGTFPSWPKSAREITLLDPCLGSGHFLVAAFDTLVCLRRYEEKLDLEAAIEKVLAENLFGLEIDPRCAQIGAFAVALHAWKKLGRVRPLPRVQIACCGLSVGGTKDLWVKHAEGESKLLNSMGTLYDLFKQAPLLGSLIDPDRMLPASVFSAGFEETAPLVERALAASGDEARHEAGIAAAGMVQAVRLLRGKYTLVVTNPPYLGRRRQVNEMKNYADQYEDAGKQDLATMFVARALRWCGSTGSVAMVLPQNCLFLGTWDKFRKRLLNEKSWAAVARLGEHAFESVEAAGAAAALVIISGARPSAETRFLGVNASNQRGEPPIFAPEKASRLTADPAHLMAQVDQLANPDAAITFSKPSDLALLEEYADSYQGSGLADISQFRLRFWELSGFDSEWVPHVSSPTGDDDLTGMHYAVRWADGRGAMATSPLVSIRGRKAWGKQGVVCAWLGTLPAGRYLGTLFDNSAAAIIPKDRSHLAAIWSYCSSPEYNRAVRKINQKPQVANATLVKVPFDLSRWQQVASERYPEGLPKAQSGDPTQWVFHGHPAGMLAAGPRSASPFGVADRVGANRHPSLICRKANPAGVLQVAVARLVGYRWPAELDVSMELDEAARDWATGCGALLKHADDDGIVPINPMYGEQPAEERVIAILRDSFADAGEAFDQRTISGLIAAAGSKATSLKEWLLTDFFNQHCAIFEHPFVWHIWDGRDDGFNVLVHYHRLVAPGHAGRQLLEKLTYAYLKDWIDRQETEVREGAPGAEARLAAATRLQKELKGILDGEVPYDIFVRWKPLAQQPIGWSPDINDGICVNIRPFLLANDVGRKGAGVLRVNPGIKFEGKSGHEDPDNRPRRDFPWLWGCDPKTNPSHVTDFLGESLFTGRRWNNLHYTLATRRAARAAAGGTDR